MNKNPIEEYYCIELIGGPLHGQLVSRLYLERLLEEPYAGGKVHYIYTGAGKATHMEEAKAA